MKHAIDAQLPDALRAKLEAVRRRLGGLGTVAVALSGGVDSAVVAAAARETLGDGAVALTATGPFFPEVETEAARRIAARLGLRHRIVPVDLLDDAAVAANPPDRCYFCKKRIFATLRERAAEEEVEHVLDGTHEGDAADYRPGRQALAEAGAISPLAEAGLDKGEVRALARAYGLPDPDAPPAACLASRIPYGEAITLRKLRQVEAAEAFLRARGFALCRVRHHGALARVEVAPEAVARLAGPLREETARALEELGFGYVTVDLRGYRTGSLNEGLGSVASGERDGSAG